MTELPTRVLVLRFSSAGDIVLTAPALHTLATAWPQAQICFATKARFAELVRYNPHVHQVMSLEADESVWDFRRRLEAFRPQALLDLHGKLRSRILSGLVPRARRASWRKRSVSQTLAVRLRLRPYQSEMRVADRYHLGVEELVGKALPPGELKYHVPAEVDAEVHRILAESGLDLSLPIVGMSPGALWETKQWPSEYFGGLARRLGDAGYQVAVSGSPAEAPITAAVARTAPGVVDLAGRLSLGELPGFISLCVAFVANDSGPMHMARALGVPTLAFFGSTDPGQFDFSGHSVLFGDLPCSPCSLHGRRRCPKRHYRCMLSLDVDAAWAALEPLLTAGRLPCLSA